MNILCCVEEKLKAFVKGMIIFVNIIKIVNLTRSSNSMFPTKLFDAFEEHMFKEESTTRFQSPTIKDFSRRGFWKKKKLDNSFQINLSQSLGIIGV
jgi:hypothetical protein